MLILAIEQSWHNNFLRSRAILFGVSLSTLLEELRCFLSRSDYFQFYVAFLLRHKVIADRGRVRNCTLLNV